MAATMYAQTIIKVDGKVIMEGDKVTKSDLGDHYDELKESGAIGPRLVVEGEDESAAESEE